MITLMYHGISSPNTKPPVNREAGADFYDVDLEDFKAQMQCLKESGHNHILTFDDGELNNYTLALPVLKEFDVNAYFFIIVKKIGQEGYMGWSEIKAMIDAGMTIGSHGLSHEIMTNLKDSQIIEELRASKGCLEINLGVPIDTFSVPRGFCNDKIIQMAYEAGYSQIFISDKPEGLISNCIPRVAVKSNWTLERFQQALTGQRPLSVKIGDACKNTAKIVLKGAGYNHLRRLMIYLIK